MSCALLLMSGMAVALAFGAPVPDSIPKPATRASASDRPRRAGAADELARRLLGEDGADQDAARKILSLMNEAQERLTRRYDSSDETQSVQARALKAIDDAITQAKQNQNRPQSSSSSRQKGESRQAGRRQTQRTAGKADAAKPSAGSSQTGGSPSGGGPKSTRLSDRAELRRGWGFLPQRDREAIVQGSNEEFHAKYRDQIERYYRAIAERAEQEK